ncbi:MAG: Nif3-like dinuclear metal center hexameric protein [Clostridiales bacterium]|jgi:dinuclear metal center YbgI/SA1388 family protein|nr:Nif3-like dinuclear metal center hexameric protein [Clostridiales bacterium]
MLTAEQIISQFEEWAPMSYAEDWDNVGLLIGDAGAPVKKILVALDATEEVIGEAVAGGFDFIICHHPLVYNPIKRVTSADSTGRKIISLVKNGIGCFCAHTNLDKAVGGVSDCLAEKIGLNYVSPLIKEENECIGIGRVGFISEETTLSRLAENVKISLNLPSLRFSGSSDKKIKKVAICGGDGSSARYVDAAISQNCDAYITGDLRYHCVQEALESGIGLIDITHYGSEILVVDAIISRFKNQVEIFPSSIDGQVFKHIGNH